MDDDTTYVVRVYGEPIPYVEGLYLDTAAFAKRMTDIVRALADAGYVAEWDGGECPGYVQLNVVPATRN
jgi:hypothetical protein